MTVENRKMGFSCSEKLSHQFNEGRGEKNFKIALGHIELDWTEVVCQNNS